MNKNHLPRLLALAAGTGLLATVGTAAALADDEYGSNDVSVNVEIDELDEPGVLAMTVASGSTTLEENGSDELVRQFTGTLPTVTVTDTRAAEDIPDGVAWYVLGTASDFTSTTGEHTITADHLGWAPSLLSGNDSGAVMEGEQVDTVMDSGTDNVGLKDQELLALAADSAEQAAESGSWTANAELFLRTEATVEPGSYSSTLTLSLFE